MPPRGRPFQKGQSGNPKGRPPATGLKDAIYRELGAPFGTSGMTRLEAFAHRLVELCIEGDVGAMRLLLDRGWPAKLELNHDGLPLVRVIDRSDTAQPERDDSEPMPEPREAASDERLADPALLELRAVPRDLPEPSTPSVETSAPVFLLRPVPFDDFQDAAD